MTIAVLILIQTDSKMIGTVLNILLVEDQFFNQQLIIAMLAMHNIAADNGKDAISILEKEHFDIVIMDIQMPMMDGIEAAKIIRDPNSSDWIMMCLL